MSRASEWAERMQGIYREETVHKVARPPIFRLKALTARVADDGELALDDADTLRTQLIEPRTALAFAAWIVEIFGES